jgi:hypothetical protein
MNTSMKKHPGSKPARYTPERFNAIRQKLGFQAPANCHQRNWEREQEAREERFASHRK